MAPIDRGACLKHVPYGTRLRHIALLQGHRFSTASGVLSLLSFQKARIVFDATVRFCDRFVDKRSRTHDQMVQAARSGKQNILEGSRASGTSKETELKLTNVARASFEELLEDYRDFLRTAGHAQWEKDSRTPDMEE